MPTDEQALQFAIMLSAGLPPEQAILYFIETEDPNEIALTLGKWQRSKAVKRAQLSLMGKSWTEMSLDERVDLALNQHYSTLAYLLYSTNYISVGQTDKSKLDTARQALEAKKAGTAGKGDALSQFMDDLKTGKVRLASPVKAALKDPLAH